MPDWLFVGFILSGISLVFFLVSLPMMVRLRRMARVYPGGSFAGERAYRGVSGRFVGTVMHVEGRAGRGNALDLSVGEQGMGISMSFPFRRLGPPVFIPWSAIHALQGKPGGLFSGDCLRVEVCRISTPLWLEFLWRHGDAMVVILKYWEENRAVLPGKAVFQSNPA